MDEAFSALDPLIRREMQEQLVVQDVDRARVLIAASVMEPPHATMPLSAGVRGALRTMRARRPGRCSPSRTGASWASSPIAPSSAP